MALASAVCERVLVAQQIADAFLQAADAAGAPRPAFDSATADPAPQFRRLIAREMRRERVIRGIEQMMAFIEHIAGRQLAFLGPQAPR